MKESAEALDGWGLLVYTVDKKEETFLYHCHSCARQHLSKL